MSEEGDVSEERRNHGSETNSSYHCRTIKFGLTMTQFLPTCTYDPTAEAFTIVSSSIITLSPICSG